MFALPLHRIGVHPELPHQSTELLRHLGQVLGRFLGFGHAVGGTLRSFRDAGVIAMKADWTNKDEAIARALDEHGRSGVPLNLVYPASGGEPEVLPAMLTPAVVLDALARAGAKGRS